ncbi:MAG TPA: hypothetical protein VIX87_07325 [Steroidobacteraceae bacterium]
MPDRETLQRARRDQREGKAASTQAGEFIREEMHHIREGKHGARSTRQAVAIGLSKARRAGVDLKPPAAGKTSEKTRRSAERAYQRGHGAAPERSTGRSTGPRRSSATLGALRREAHRAATPRALSSQARSAAKRRGPAARSAAAQAAAATRKRRPGTRSRAATSSRPMSRELRE